MVKDNSMCKARQHMQLVQTNCDNDVPEAVNWIIEDTMYDHSQTFARITK